MQMVKKILVGILFLGLGIFIVGLVLTKGDFSKTIAAFTVEDEYEFVEQTKVEDINTIYIDVVSNNIIFHKSEDGEVKVEYYESEYDKIAVNIANNRLSIIGQYKQKFRFFSFRIKPNKLKDINIYIPNTFNGNADIEIVSGNLKIDGFNLEEIYTDLTSGNQTLDNLTVRKNAKLNSTSGNIKLNNLDVNGNLYLDLTSGNVTTNNIKANTILLDTTSGNSKFYDVTFNNIEADITSGNLDMLIIGNKNDYSADFEVTSGSVLYAGEKYMNQRLNPGKSKNIIIDITSGNSEIIFK